MTEELTQFVSSSVARSKPHLYKIMATAEGRLPSYTIANLPPEEVYDDGYLLIEHQNYYLSCGGQPIYLPRTEFLLISRLARSIDRVVTAEELWRAAWGDAKPLNYGALRVYIYRLRNRLLPYRLQIDVLVNVGYRLLAPPRE